MRRVELRHLRWIGWRLQVILVVKPHDVCGLPNPIGRDGRAVQTKQRRAGTDCLEKVGGLRTIFAPSVHASYHDHFPRARTATRTPCCRKEELTCAEWSEVLTQGMRAYDEDALQLFVVEILRPRPTCATQALRISERTADSLGHQTPPWLRVYACASGSRVDCLSHAFRPAWAS